MEEELQAVTEITGGDCDTLALVFGPRAELNISMATYGSCLPEL